MPEISFEENRLNINDKSISFDLNIFNAITLEDKVIVMLDVPNDNPLMENIIAFNFEGQPIWTVQPFKEKFPEIKMTTPYVGMFKREDGNINATNFYGICVEISSKDGKILSKSMSK